MHSEDMSGASDDYLRREIASLTKRMKEQEDRLFNVTNAVMQLMAAQLKRHTPEKD